MDTTSHEAVMVQGTQFTSVDYYDPKVKAAAYDKYLSSDLSLTDIALDLAVPSSVVGEWSVKGKWKDRKHEIEMELFRSAEDKYRHLVMTVRVPVLERHLRVSGKLEQAIESAVDELNRSGDVGSKGHSMELKRLTESLSAATSVSARAAGISEKFFGDALRQSDADGGGKRPLITLNVNPQLAPERMVSIEAEYEDA